VKNFTSLEINNFKGTGAPGNLNAVPVLLEKGKGFKTNLDKKLIKWK
jgi:hypothetical protein